MYVSFTGELIGTHLAREAGEAGWVDKDADIDNHGFDQPRVLQSLNDSLSWLDLDSRPLHLSLTGCGIMGPPRKMCNLGRQLSVFEEARG